MLRRLRDGAVYAELEERAASLAAALEEAAPGAGVQRVGSLLTLFLADGPVRNFDDASRADGEAYGTLFRGLLERAVYIPPSPFEAWFVSLAHGDEEIGRTAQAVSDVLS